MKYEGPTNGQRTSAVDIAPINFDWVAVQPINLAITCLEGGITHGSNKTQEVMTGAMCLDSSLCEQLQQTLLYMHTTTVRYYV